MNFIELSEFVKSIKKHQEDEIVIDIERPSFGPTATTSILGIAIGHDWNKGKIIIYPQKSLVEKPDSMTLYDAAADLILNMAIEGLKQKHCKWPYDRALQIMDSRLPDWKRICTKEIK